jgi:hypothetical protein
VWGVVVLARKEILKERRNIQRGLEGERELLAGKEKDNWKKKKDKRLTVVQSACGLQVIK